MEGHCLQAMKTVHHYANGCFDWLISGQQSVNPWREAIFILSGKCKRFTFVHPMLVHTGWTNINLLYLPDIIEIASLEGLSLWCPEINQSKTFCNKLSHFETIFSF